MATLTGTAANDTLEGTSLDDFIAGLGGDDFLLGGAGNDTLDLGTAGTGDITFDQARGGTGDDLLIGGSGGPTLLTGGAGDDTLDGSLGSLDEADYFDVGFGLDGGPVQAAGDVTGVNVDLAAGITIDDGEGGSDVLIGIEIIRGSFFNDTIAGDNGENSVYAGDGDDTVSGQGGSDFLFGGSGHDTISAGDGDDYVGGGSGSDYLSGEAGNDTVYAGDGDDYVAGGSGDDYLLGGAGNDTLDLGTASTGGITFDQSRGGTGDDLLIGGSGDRTLLTGGAGDDTLDGSLGSLDEADYFDVGFGLDGGPVQAAGDVTGVNVDLAAGIASDDGEGGSDVLIGIENVRGSIFNDTIAGDNAGNALYAGDGDDTVSGQGGSDFLLGGAGNDTLDAGDGNDTLWGDAGDDLLEGGEGADVFVFSQNDGNDVVSDFDVTNDTLNLSVFGFADADAVVSASSSSTIGGESGVLIDLGAGGSLFLVGLTEADLNVANLIL